MGDSSTLTAAFDMASNFFVFFSFSFLISAFNFVFSSLSDTVFAWESFKIQYLH